VAEDFSAEHGLNPVEYVIADAGGSAGRGLASADQTSADLLGGISIELVNPDLRPYSSSAFVTALQAEVHPHPLLEELSFRGARFGPGGDSLSVDLFGADSTQLNAAAEALKAALAGFPEVSALEDSLSPGKEELILSLTPQGQALGFEAEALGRTLRDRLSGIEAASFPAGPRTATIRVELPEKELTADFLDRTLMRTVAGDYVPLSDLVTVERREGYSAIRRENGLQVVTVTGDLSEDDPTRASEVQSALEDDILPRISADFGVEVRLSGQAAQEREFFSDTWVALVACLVGIYLTLAWIFGQWLRPLVVMAVIPFGLVGAVFGHWHWDVPLSLFSIVGLIGMSGIIINDALVLVSTIDEYARTRSIRAAIVDGVADRFRAVLLTTLTTVLGLAPLLFERSSQAEFLKPTVITLSYGLGFGMVLVLLVVPAIIVVQEDLGRSGRALRRALAGGRPEMRKGLRWAVAALMALFVALPGWLAVTGAVPGWTGQLWPALAEEGEVGLVTGLFLIGAVLVLGLYSLLTLRALRASAARRSAGARYGLDGGGAET
jgi:multidrug efflux pump subunit AcrB